MSDGTRSTRTVERFNGQDVRIIIGGKVYLYEKPDEVWFEHEKHENLDGTPKLADRAWCFHIGTTRRPRVFGKETEGEAKC